MARKRIQKQISLDPQTLAALRALANAKTGGNESKLVRMLIRRAARRLQLEKGEAA